MHIENEMWSIHSDVRVLLAITSSCNRKKEVSCDCLSQRVDHMTGEEDPGVSAVSAF